MERGAKQGPPSTGPDEITVTMFMLMIASRVSVSVWVCECVDGGLEAVKTEDLDQLAFNLSEEETSLASCYVT